MSKSPIEYLKHILAEVNYLLKTSHNISEVDFMRDRLIHHYFGVDYEIVWDVVKNEIPMLKIQIENVIKDLEKGEVVE